MVDFTATYAQLMNWTECDDTGGVPTISTSELDCDTYLETILHIDVAHKDANDAGGNNLEVVVWAKSGDTNNDWSERVRFQASGGQANAQVLATTCGAGQPNPDRIEVSTTANFETPGDIYFLLDSGTLASSCIVVNKDYVSNDYIQAVNNLTSAYDSADYLYDIVNQWDIQLVGPIKATRVTFHNLDADATYACRVRYSQGTDME